MAGFNEPEATQTDALIPIELDGAQLLKLQVQNGGDDLQSVGALPGVDLDVALHSVAEFARTATKALSRVAPDELEIEFGVGFEAKAGKLTGLIVDGKGECTLTVRLKWTSPDAG